MRTVLDESQFTPFGLWIRQYLRDSSDGLSVTNLDYVLEDFTNKKVQLFEEKQSGGKIHTAQLLTFSVVDNVIRRACATHAYEYWGFYELVLPKDCTMPGPGMKLNGQDITCEELVEHMNFREKFCDPKKFPWKPWMAA